MRQLIIYFYIVVNFIFSNVIYRVPIEGTIDLGLPPYIERSINEAERENLIASEEITKKTNVPIFSISGITDLKKILISQNSNQSEHQLQKLNDYLEKWG